LPEPRQLSKAKEQQQQEADGDGDSAGRKSNKPARWTKVQHKRLKGSGFADAWDDEDRQQKRRREQIQRLAAAAEEEEPAEEVAAWLSATERPGAKRRRAPAPQLPSAVRPVMIDAPGCSINPDEQARQDAVAAVVAAERRKEIARLLERKAPPAALALASAAAADGEEGAEGVKEDELQRLLTGGGAGRSDTEDEEEDEAAVVAAPTTPEGAAAVKAQQQQARSKTQKDRNRESRRRAVEAELAARRALKAQRRALDALPAIERQIAAEEHERTLRRERRQADLAEKRATLPPRLGKRRFVVEPPMAPDAEEAKLGSLRAITPCAIVAADRLRSLQHRGLVEPRRPAPGSVVGVKRRGRRSEYVVGSRVEKAAAAQAEVHALRDARLKLQRKAQKRGLMVPGVQAGPASVGLLGAAAGGGAAAAAAAAGGDGAALPALGW
jgi:nucleolar protein 53